MKTDSQLKNDIGAELDWDPRFNATEVGIAVKDGVVTVSGHINSFQEKYAIERAVRRVSGVKAIAVELDVKISSQHKRGDTEIASDAETALKLHTPELAEQVQVTVEKGMIRLHGTLDWNFQRHAVESAVRPLLGVVGVINALEIKQRALPKDITSRIANALKRQAQREADRIKVDLQGDTVKLSGKVHSWAEFDAAGGAAWSSPGVRRVINELNVLA